MDIVRNDATWMCCVVNYFEKIRVLKANLLKNSEAWDNQANRRSTDFVLGRKIKRNNWGNSENNGRGENSWSL